MGNPASVIKKKTEKRRKRFEARLGPGAYLPKAEREELNQKLAEAKKVDDAERARKAAEVKARGDAKKKAAAEKKAAAAKNPPAEPKA